MLVNNIIFIFLFCFCHFIQKPMKKTLLLTVSRCFRCICILTIWASGIDVAHGCSRTDSVEGYRLNGHVITSQAQMNIWSCFQACKRTLGCQSINYKVETYTCDINNRTKKGRPYKFVAMKGSVYLENPFRGRRKRIWRIRYDDGLCQYELMWIYIT